MTLFAVELLSREVQCSQPLEGMIPEKAVSPVFGLNCNGSSFPTLQVSRVQNLWICLICGHIGCGRYVSRHAYKHFEETQHTYAMQLTNHRVWDYAGDNYVHRLVASKTDGKLVQYECEGDVCQEEKIDALQLEYSYLLTSQLESQRIYWENKIVRIEKDTAEEVPPKMAAEACLAKVGLGQTGPI
ncbi:UNVERIFIED_CONTAM: hypothetical protein K2H54_005369 [Gekko kuhli]